MNTTSYKVEPRWCTVYGLSCSRLGAVLSRLPEYGHLEESASSARRVPRGIEATAGVCCDRRGTRRMSDFFDLLEQDVRRTSRGLARTELRLARLRWSVARVEHP